MATDLHHLDQTGPPARPHTDERHVAAAERAARATSEHANRCWAELVAAIEANRGVEHARHELIVASAQLSYAWAVYHCTAVDAVEEDHR